MFNPWPIEMRYQKTKHILYVTFDDGVVAELPAALLRTESPSAEVQGHHPSQKVTVTGKENITITQMEPVGNYAVRLIFDDGHNTGLYTWAYLYELYQKQNKGDRSCGCNSSAPCHE